jgi:hypothetical protein
LVKTVQPGTSKAGETVALGLGLLPVEVKGVFLFSKSQRKDIKVQITHQVVLSPDQIKDAIEKGHDPAVAQIGAIVKFTVPSKIKPGRYGIMLLIKDTLREQTAEITIE